MTNQLAPPVSQHEASIHRFSRLGLLASMVFLGSVGVWATTTEMAGAVIASGQFVVINSSKKIQHQTGGVVAALKVREGSRVREGDLLVRLDDTVIRTNLQIIRNQLDEDMMRRARLQAERDGVDAIVVPGAFHGRSAEPDTQNIIRSEQRLFETRRSAREGQKSQLRNRIAQMQNEISGHEAQLVARRQQLALIGPELAGIRDLLKKNLVPLSRANALERDATAISGQIGQLVSMVAQSQGRIAEVELQILQIDEDLRTEMSRELREVDARLLEAQERRTAAQDQLQRTDLLSPATGIVHQLAIHAQGAVLGPAEVAMLIVPEHEQLELEGRIMPQDVDQLNVGQSAVVRLMAFNQRTTPELQGSVRRISADITRDSVNTAPYYTIRIALSDGERDKLGELRLLAGMQADAFVQTESRTPLTYLVKPLRDQMGRAFRER